MPREAAVTPVSDCEEEAEEAGLPAPGATAAAWETRKHRPGRQRCGGPFRAEAEIPSLTPPAGGTRLRPYP